jgi:hypothetical protein
MSSAYRFPILGLVTLFVLAGILSFVLRGHGHTRRSLWLVALIVGPGGMAVAKYGTSIGAPWWLYYTIPVLLTLVLPVVTFRMTRRQTAFYWALALLSAPLIHVIFALTLGWREYMPFLPVP